MRLNGESEHTDDAVQVFIFPSDGAAACRRTQRGGKTQYYKHIMVFLCFFLIKMTSQCVCRTAATVCGGVPEAGGGRLQSGAVLLHDDAGD